MAISNITTGLQTVAAAGPVTPTTGLDISGVTGYCTAHVRVVSLSATAGQIPRVELVLEDSVDGFATSKIVWSKALKGTIDTNADVHFAIPRQNIEARFGTASAKLRANVQSIVTSTGVGSPSLKVDAWLES